MSMKFSNSSLILSSIGGNTRPFLVSSRTGSGDADWSTLSGSGDSDWTTLSGVGVRGLGDGVRGLGDGVF